MPLHSIGSKKIRNSFWGITWGDVLSVVTCALFLGMPGVDHRALMRWIIDHLFCGSVAAASIWLPFLCGKFVEWGGIGLYALLYWWQNRNLPGSSTLASAKLHPNQPWAWADPDSKLAKKFAELKSRSIWFTLQFHAIVTAVQFLYFASVVQIDWESKDFRWEWVKGDPELSRADPDTIPDKSVVAFQCIIGSLVADFGFYWGHRLLHHKRLYRWHKRHHEHSGELNVTIYAAAYVDLLDTFICAIIPGAAVVVYFKMHVWTLCLLSIPLSLQTVRGHGGYNLSRLTPLNFDPSVTLPLATDIERNHDLHHRYTNVNFGGVWLIWDRIMGTWFSPDEEEEREMRKMKGMGKVAEAEPMVEQEETNETSKKQS